MAEEKKQMPDLTHEDWKRFQNGARPTSSKKERSGRIVASVTIILLLSAVVRDGVNYMRDPAVRAGSWVPSPPARTAAPQKPQPAVAYRAARPAKPGAGAAFAAQRQALCWHFKMHPDVITARVATGGTNPEIDVTTRAGMSDHQLLPLARRIRHYLAANFQGNRAGIVATVTLRSANAPVGAVIATGWHTRGEKSDPFYHVIQNQHIVE